MQTEIERYLASSQYSAIFMIINLAVAHLVIEEKTKFEAWK